MKTMQTALLLMTLGLSACSEEVALPQAPKMSKTIQVQLALQPDSSLRMPAEGIAVDTTGGKPKGN
jgi:hypothetical protein